MRARKKSAPADDLGPQKVEEITGHPCLLALVVFTVTMVAVGTIAREGRKPDYTVGAAFGATPFMAHPATGWIAVALLSSVLLLGRQLSVGGALVDLTARWRHVHVGRLASSSHVCVQIQRLSNPVLDVVGAAFGFCAEEDFYMIMAPICWWIFPFLQPFFYNLMLVTLLGLLVGDSLKDILYLPRPSHPKLWTHSHSKGTAEEYGMPSTHAMNAVSNSLIFSFCADGECGRHAVMGFDQSTLAVGAVAWVFGVCCSRLYLGVHTVDDIAIGCGLGALLARLWLLVHERVDELLDHGGPEVPVVMLGAIIGTLTLTRAKPPSWTPSHRQSANISGLLSGLLLAMWATGKETQLPEQHPPSAFDAASGWIVLARLGIGLGIIFGGEQIIKAVLVPLVSKLRDEPLGYKADRVYIPVKYLSQTWMAVGIITAPIAMSAVNVPTPGEISVNSNATIEEIPAIFLAPLARETAGFE